MVHPKFTCQQRSTKLIRKHCLNLVPVINNFPGFLSLPGLPKNCERAGAEHGKNGFLGTCPFPSNLPLSLPYAFPHSNPSPTPTQFLLYSTFFLTPSIPTPSGDLRWRKKSGCLGFEEGKKRKNERTELGKTLEWSIYLDPFFSVGSGRGRDRRRTFLGAGRKAFYDKPSRKKHPFVARWSRWRRLEKVGAGQTKVGVFCNGFSRFFAASKMNFSPFGTHFPGTIPGIHQFASAGGLVTSVPSSTNHDSNNRYHTIQSNVNSHFNQGHKYNGHTNVTSAPATTTSGQYSIPYSQHSSSDPNDHKQRNMYPGQTTAVSTTSSGPVQSSQELSQDITALLQQADSKRVLQNPSSWQTLAPGASVADYLSHLPGTALPLSLHHFLKYSAENIKKETQNPSALDMGQNGNGQQQHGNGMIIPATQTIANILGQPGGQQGQHGQQG